MAFKQVTTGRRDAIQIKKGTVITGHWTAVHAIPTATPGKLNYVYTFCDSKMNLVDCFGNGSLNYALMPEGTPNEELSGRLVRVTGLEKKKLKKGQNPAQLVNIEVDASAKRYLFKAKLDVRTAKKGEKKVKKTLAKRLKR